MLSSTLVQPMRGRRAIRYSDGTTHVLFEPLDFIARLAALVELSTWGIESARPPSRHGEDDTGAGLGRVLPFACQFGFDIGLLRGPRARANRRRAKRRKAANPPALQVGKPISLLFAGTAMSKAERVWRKESRIASYEAIDSFLDECKRLHVSPFCVNAA